MYDVELVRSILGQVRDACCKIQLRILSIRKASDFTNSESGMEKLDSICMLFIAIGESLKNIDKITQNNLLIKYPQVDWVGVKGFRDIIAHHYFDVDADQVFWLCTHNLEPLLKVVDKILGDLN